DALAAQLVGVGEIAATFDAEAGDFEQLRLGAEDGGLGLLLGVRDLGGDLLELDDAADGVGGGGQLVDLAGVGPADAVGDGASALGGGAAVLRLVGLAGADDDVLGAQLLDVGQRLALVAFADGDDGDDGRDADDDAQRRQ